MSGYLMVMLQPPKLYEIRGYFKKNEKKLKKMKKRFDGSDQHAYTSLHALRRSDLKRGGDRLNSLIFKVFIDRQAYREYILCTQ